MNQPNNVINLSDKRKKKEDNLVLTSRLKDLDKIKKDIKDHQESFSKSLILHIVGEII